MNYCHGPMAHTPVNLLLVGLIDYIMFVNDVQTKEEKNKGNHFWRYFDRADLQDISTDGFGEGGGGVVGEWVHVPKVVILMSKSQDLFII